PPARSASDPAPHAITVADFNGDGIPDLAVAAQSGNAVNFFLGNGDGTFQDALPYATHPMPNGIVSGDFNGDGLPDVATANFNGADISVLLNNGNGPQA